MPRAQAGVAAAIATTSRQVGATLGVAVVGAIVAAHAGGAGLAAASHPAWWTLAALRRASCSCSGCWRTTRRADESARRTAVAAQPGGAGCVGWPAMPDDDARARSGC